MVATYRHQDADPKERFVEAPGEIIRIFDRDRGGKVVVVKTDDRGRTIDIRRVPPAGAVVEESRLFVPRDPAFGSNGRARVPIVSSRRGLDPAGRAAPRAVLLGQGIAEVRPGLVRQVLEAGDHVRVVRGNVP